MAKKIKIAGMLSDPELQMIAGHFDADKRDFMAAKLRKWSNMLYESAFEMREAEKSYDPRKLEFKSRSPWS